MPPRKPADRRAASAATPSTEDRSADSTTTSAHGQASPAQAQDAPAGSLARSGSASSLRRLDTLQRPALPSSPSSSSLHSRGGASRPIARPRGIGRRSQHGRAELEKAELERKQAEAASKPQPKPWQSRRDNPRGRGAMRGRMRGGYVGENERRSDPVAQASGPFSLGQVTRDSGKKSHGNSGRGGGSSSGGGGGGGGGGNIGGSGSSSQRAAGVPDGSLKLSAVGQGNRVKQELRKSGDAPMTDVHIKQEDGGYISSDAEDERLDTRKLNIDTLVDLTGEDEDDVVYLPPVRIQRVEHKERTLLANAPGSLRPDGSVATAEGNDVAALHATDRRRAKQRSKTVEVHRETQRYKGTYTDSSSEDDVLVKQEHHEGSRSQATAQSPPTSPDTRRRFKAGIKAGSTSDHHRPNFQTKEEELEWEIRQRDLRILRAELGQLSLPSTAPLDEEALPDAETTDDPRADKMYLFQFPAILPTLVPVKPKQEDEDVNMQDVPAVGMATKSTSTKQDTKPGHSKPAADIPSGLVGKLRVHKSGRAFLDWGGIPMEVSMGQEASFLQDVVLVNGKDSRPGAEDDAEQDQTAGTAMSMGQVKGRFVVVPQWDAIFDQVY